MTGRPIVGNDTAEARNENLPYPVVKYPSSGAFIAFKPAHSADLYFCACAREALENFIECQREDLQESHQSVTPENVLQHSIPDEGRRYVAAAGVDEIDDIIDAFQFEPGICHKCNNAVPKFKYCHDMYGTKFKQNYGWYLKQKAYEFGICRPGSDTLLTHTDFDKLPSNVVDIVDEDLIGKLQEKAERFEELRQKRFEREREINDRRKEKIR